MYRRTLTTLLSLAIYLHALAFGYSQCHILVCEHTADAPPHFHLSMLGLSHVSAAAHGGDRSEKRGDRHLSVEPTTPDDDDEFVVSAPALLAGPVADEQAVADLFDARFTMHGMFDRPLVALADGSRPNRTDHVSSRRCPLYLRAQSLLI